MERLSISSDSAIILINLIIFFWRYKWKVINVFETHKKENKPIIH